MRRIGHDHLFAGIATLGVIGPGHEDRGQLALGPGRRLGRDGMHAHDHLEPLVKLPDDRQRALGKVFGLEGMDRLKSRHLSHFVV